MSGLILYSECGRLYFIFLTMQSIQKELELGGEDMEKSKKCSAASLPERNLQRRACSDRDCNRDRDQSGGRTASGKVRNIDISSNNLYDISSVSTKMLKKLG